MSGLPPGAVGMMMRSERDGQFASCARAGDRTPRARRSAGQQSPAVLASSTPPWMFSISCLGAIFPNWPDGASCPEPVHPGHRRSAAEVAHDAKSTPGISSQPMDVRRLGEVILDRSERQRWCRAAMLAGSLPYMWRHKAATAARTDVRPARAEAAATSVLILGEMVDACGFADDIGARIGSRDNVHGHRYYRPGARCGIRRPARIGGALGTWRFDYTSTFADGSFDCVAVLQAVQHADDWRITGQELLRLMKSDRNILLARDHLQPAHEGAGRAWTSTSRPGSRKLSAGVGFDPFAYSYYSADDLVRAFDGLVSRTRHVRLEGHRTVLGHEAVAIPSFRGASDRSRTRHPDACRRDLSFRTTALRRFPE